MANTNEMTLSQQFAQECRQEMSYYLSRAKMAKNDDLPHSHKVYVSLAWLNRANARKWDAR